MEQLTKVIQKQNTILNSILTQLQIHNLLMIRQLKKTTDNFDLKDLVALDNCTVDDVENFVRSLVDDGK